jgi:hypothetical protein
MSLLPNQSNGIVGNGALKRILFSLNNIRSLLYTKQFLFKKNVCYDEFMFVCLFIYLFILVPVFEIMALCLVDKP